MLGIPEHDRTDGMIAGTGSRLRREITAGDGACAAAPTAPAGTEPRHSAPAAPARRCATSADDFAISRQRSWGTPIPIVYCEDCGTVPVPARAAAGAAAARHHARPVPATRWPSARSSSTPPAPAAAAPARRETDTLDCHFDALWLWVPACVPAEARARSLEEILALADLRHWLPSERLVAGSDSGNFVFDQRIVTKALRDIGPLAFLADGEPFAGCLFHEMVISDGRKMSKHLGNVVDPDELVERYGADTVRLAVLYAARPQRSLNWSDSAVLRCHRFLTQVWEYSQLKLAEAAPIWSAPAPAAIPQTRRAGQRHDRAPQAETRRSGARRPSRGSPRTWRTSRCTAPCATSCACSTGSRTSRSACSRARASSAAPTARR